MTTLAMNNMDVILAVSIFGLVLSLWFIGMLLWQLRLRMHTGRVERRLGLIDGGNEQEHGSRVLRLFYEGEEITARVSGQKQAKGYWHRVRQICREAGYTMPAELLFAGVMGMAVVVFMFAMLISGMMAAVTCGGALPIVFWAYTKMRADKRKAIFDQQLVEALELSSRSLRAGHPLLTAFQLAADELNPPVRDIFAEIVQSQNMGISLQDALIRAGQMSQSNDMKLFATCVVIQMQSGGNLADMMERLASVIRDRMRLGRRVRVLTAQTQFSKRVLIVLPFVVFAVLNLINADYMLPMYTTFLGQMMLAGAGFSLLVGGWSMNRMSRLKY